MCIPFKQSLKIPTAPVNDRTRLPEFLYIVVDDIAFPTIGSSDGALTIPRIDSHLTKRGFKWNDITKQRIETHFKYKSGEVETSSFASAYESEATALKFPQSTSVHKRKGRILHATKLIVDTDGLVPASASTTGGTQIPIWVEQGALPKVPKGVLNMTPAGFDAFEARAWICLDEVRAVLGLKDSDGETGEWLACGYIPRARVCGQVVLQEDTTKKKSLKDEEVVEDVSRTRKKGKEKVRQEEYTPQVPVRTSSLRSFRSDDTSERKRENAPKGRLPRHRSFDSKDKHSVKLARSLLKQALLMSAEEVEIKRLLQETKDIQIPIEVKKSESRLKQHASAALQDTPAETPPQAEINANKDRADDRSISREALTEYPLRRSKSQRTVAFQDPDTIQKISRRSRREVVQKPPRNVETVTEDKARASPAYTPLPTQRIPPTTPVSRTDTPTSSISPLTLAWFDRIERNQDRGLELKERIAKMTARQQGMPRRRNEDAAIDCSTYSIPEDVCSESVLNECVDLPVSTPAQSMSDSS